MTSAVSVSSKTINTKTVENNKSCGRLLGNANLCDVMIVLAVKFECHSDSLSNERTAYNTHHRHVNLSVTYCNGRPYSRFYMNMRSVHDCTKILTRHVHRNWHFTLFFTRLANDGRLDWICLSSAAPADCDSLIKLSAHSVSRMQCTIVH